MATNPTLSATYNSPNPPHSHTFQQPLSTPLPAQQNGDSPSVTAKSAYLSDLRSSVTKLQAEINGFLTKRMEEDNKRAAEAQGGGKDAAAQRERERKEEENYGEENVDEDA